MQANVAAIATEISLFMAKFIPYRLIRPHVSANGPEIFAKLRKKIPNFATRIRVPDRASPSM